MAYVDDDDLEVIWSGGELLPPRPTKPGDTWQAPKRLYNKGSKPEPVSEGQLTPLGDEQHEGS